ncbi:hypothetical protein C8R46DRAFT_1349110 [Mycena filopes]|nr:hypothetical protein C8R46DRAFT_1349110 [Mycena filopes]
MKIWTTTKRRRAPATYFPLPSRRLQTTNKLAHTPDDYETSLAETHRIWNNARRYTSGQYQFFTHEYKTPTGNVLGLGLRADTPFTSAPLDDDFDAADTRRWSRTTRQTTVEPTASGLYGRLEAVTRTTTPAGVAIANNHRRRKKTAKLDHTHADWGASKTGDGAPGRSLRRMRAKDRIKAGGMNGRSGLGPLAGQDYEIVEYEIVEEGPERTVSISTWREQAIQEADSDDAMSVYYVNVDDCQGHPEPTEIGVFVEREVNIASGSGSNKSAGKSKGSGKSRASRRREEEPPPDARTKFERGSSAPGTSTPYGSGTRAGKSVSTISNIALTPTTPALEQILVSCEPSLLHISPILQRVGILRTEHLRAVGKLSEDTRNKEVKEEVLKLGVTVVEWAILLDKLQAL